MTDSANTGQIAAPIQFWTERHAARDPWTSGGDKGLPIGENREFYAIRLAMIARQIRQHLSAERGLQILDAGCGKGFLTDSLRSFGHEAVGFDSSPVAIDYATEKYGEHFSVSQLHQYAPTSSFDVVVCMDVLFHVLKDDLWEASLRALARCASTESLLIITDVFGDASFPLGDYIVHRSRIQYEEVLVDYGFTLVELEPYDFGANPNSLGVFRRAA